MSMDPIAYCRRQAERFPLGETSGILDEQFCEMNETLARLLADAARKRTSRQFAPATLRKKIESMLGDWTLHRAMPRIRRRRITRKSALRIESIEWAMSEGIHADGLLIRPTTDNRVPGILYLPDCSELPEAVCSGEGPAVRLATRGFAVLVLRLISRSYSACRFLNNRRHLHRLGWQLGRTFLGAEVSKARSAVSVLEAMPFVDSSRLGIFGYDQGAQIGLLTAALDRRVVAAVISNYFGGGIHPEWQPVDRLLFGKAHLFGERELLPLFAGRGLCVEADRKGRWSEDADSLTELEREVTGFTRQIDFGAAQRLAKQLGIELVASSKPCSVEAIDYLEKRLSSNSGLMGERSPCRAGSASSGNPTGRDAEVAPTLGSSRVRAAHTELARFGEFENYFNRVLASAKARRQTKRVSRSDQQAAYFNAIGRFPKRPRSFEARWKLVLDTHTFVGYEVTLSVYEELHTYGVMLVPRNAKAGDRRPAVVCQHGFQGQPLYAVGFHTNDRAKSYNMFAAKLVERGYVVFCPYLCVPNSEQRTRLVKKAWLLGGMPIGLEAQKFSRGVDFLQSLPFVDRNRIGFYGLSYGGYTAMWFTPAEPRFKVVICSGHFNDWQRKTTDLSFKPSCYLYHPDEDMYNFDILETLDHTDLATLRAPRPFAVEAGSRDGVFKMAWARSEFRRVKGIYRKLGADKNAQFFEFDGPHEIHGQETFPFLDRWLRHTPHNP